MAYSASMPASRLLLILFCCSILFFCLFLCVFLVSQCKDAIVHKNNLCRDDRYGCFDYYRTTKGKDRLKRNLCRKTCRVDRDCPVGQPSPPTAAWPTRAPYKMPLTEATRCEDDDSPMDLCNNDKYGCYDYYRTTGDISTLKRNICRKTCQVYEDCPPSSSTTLEPTRAPYKRPNTVPIKNCIDDDKGLKSAVDGKYKSYMCYFYVKIGFNQKDPNSNPCEEVIPNSDKKVKDFCPRSCFTDGCNYLGHSACEDSLLHKNKLCKDDTIGCYNYYLTSENILRIKRHLCRKTCRVSSECQDEQLSLPVATWDIAATYAINVRKHAKQVLKRNTEN